jgi:pyoverdine/dityrosine biosynthesis protein Dit1
MAFPFKVPNPAKVGPRRMPDLAELAAIVRLYNLNTKVKSIYPPGMEIHIIHDGSYIADVFGVALEEVRSYEKYFARLVQATGAGCRHIPAPARSQCSMGSLHYRCEARR